MTVTVQARGAARVLEACGFAIEQDVDVTLRFEDPPLDVFIEGVATALSDSFAVMLSELPAEVPAALGLPPHRSTFELSFTDHGMEGMFEQLSDCGSAVFPADVRCPEWPAVEVDLQRELNGGRLAAALSELEKRANLPIRWANGSETTLSVSVVQEPDWGCGDRWQTKSCSEYVKIPVRLHVATGDGQVDGEVPGALVATFATDEPSPYASCEEGHAVGDLLGVAVSVHRALLPLSALGPDVQPSNDQEAALLLSVYGSDSADVHAELQILSVDLQPSELSARFEGENSDTGRCVDVASARTVLMAASPDP